MSSFKYASCNIQLPTLLSEDYEKLYLCSDYSDVTFVVEGEHFPAHRLIMATRCEYFRAMLYGGLRESTQEIIELKIAGKEAFKAMLNYIYTGNLTFTDVETEVVLEILSLCKLFMFEDLEKEVCYYLGDNFSVKNVCSVYEYSRCTHQSFLRQVCHCYIDTHAMATMKEESFKNLSAEAVFELIEKHSFWAPEIEIFKYVYEWAQTNLDMDFGLPFNAIRVNLMSNDDIVNIVWPTGIFSDNVILNALRDLENPNAKICLRGYRNPEKNLACADFEATVVEGDMPQFLLDGNTHFDDEQGYTKHQILETSDYCIIVKLGSPSIINHIKMLLFDKDLRCFCYFVDVSVNQRDWTTVINHSRQFCRSWQYLYFPEQVVQYIRIKGVKNTVSNVFQIVHLEAMYTYAQKEMKNGFIVPKENVATLDQSALVVEGFSRSSHNLINGDYKNYDWNLGFTCHKINNGCIIVQLGQPYIISSVRLLLWDLDDRVYGYIVETSVNRRDWETAADKIRTECQSWQHLSFYPRPVVYIKIRGTSNSINGLFHCVHFECPSSENLESEKKSVEQKKEQ